MAVKYHVRVKKRITVNNRKFYPDEIIQGTFERFNNCNYFVSDFCCIGLNYIDTVNIIGCCFQFSIFPVILIVTLFLGIFVYLTAGWIGLLLLYSLSACFSVLLTFFVSIYSERL